MQPTLLGTEPPAGRRAAHKSRTRHAIEDSAWQLFAERGYDDVTLAEIAEAAGVGLRTVYRYFPTKDRLLDGRHGEMLAAASDALAALPGDAPLSRVLRSAAAAAIGDCIMDPSREQLRGRLAASTPAVAARQLALEADWMGLVTGELARRLGTGPGDLRPSVLAGAAIGAVHGALTAWVAQPGSDPLRLVDDALVLVAGLFDA